MSQSVTYGQPPVPVQQLELDWAEYMRYLYLPVWMPGPGMFKPRLPANIEFLRPALYAAIAEECAQRFDSMWPGDHYVYVSTSRGYATPANPLNRPGWHADGFGTDDVNYVWADAFPTRFATGTFREISTDHVKSAREFDAICNAAIGYGGTFHHADGKVEIRDGEPNTLYRLDPSVVHSTPIVPEPGGERSFLKISISRNRYNLRGNSHNYLFDYAWKMWDRAEIRNDPAYAGGDVGPQDEIKAAA